MPVKDQAKVYTVNEPSLRLPEHETQVGTQRQLMIDFARSLVDIRPVEQVIGRKTPLGYWILTVVNAASKDECHAIYDREWNLMNLHPSESFDFHVLDRRNQPLTELISSEASDCVIRVRGHRHAYAS